MTSISSQLDNPNNLTPEDAVLLKDRCLKDLKARHTDCAMIPSLMREQDRLIEKANLIQEWFEREESALQQKQAWFQQNQVLQRLRNS